MSAKKPLSVRLAVKSGNTTRFFTLQELLQALGVPAETAVLSFDMTQDDISLSVQLDAEETEYPGICVDGMDARGRKLYLGNFELPNKSYPGQIASRLYAGYAGFETDSPIAIVTHDVKHSGKRLIRETDFRRTNRPPTKLVYIDTDLAAARNWKDTDSKKMPEHLEDEI